MSEMINGKDPFTQAVEEAALVWHDPAAAAAREEYWQMAGDTPISGFCDSLENYLQTKYGLSAFDAGRASATGLGGPPPEVIDKAGDILREIQDQAYE
jgi:hypothetical protein